MPREPWILWGETISITHVHVANAPPLQTTQLARAHYKRPESWRWLFVATITATDSTTGSLIVRWQPSVGVGRSSVTLFNFDAFTFLFPLTTVPNQIFAGNVIGPSRTTGVSPPNQSSIFDVIVAQDIQLGAQLSFAGMTNGSTTTLVLDAYFAPNVHVRPDWFMRNFAGDELGGT